MEGHLKQPIKQSLYFPNRLQAPSLANIDSSHFQEGNTRAQPAVLSSQAVQVCARNTSALCMVCDMSAEIKADIQSRNQLWDLLMRSTHEELSTMTDITTIIFNGQNIDVLNAHHPVNVGYQSHAVQSVQYHAATVLACAPEIFLFLLFFAKVFPLPHVYFTPTRRKSIPTRPRLSFKRLF